MNWSSPNLTALEHFNLTLGTTAQQQPEIPQNTPKEKSTEHTLTAQIVAVMTQIAKS